MKKVLEASINVLVGLAAVLLIYQFVVNRASSPRLVEVGDRLPHIEGVAWGGAPVHSAASSAEGLPVL